MTKLQFPENFRWGSAVCGFCVEGAWDKDGKAPTTWDEYYRVTGGGRYYNGVGPQETCNWYERYDEYAQLAQDLHHNSFRTSIQWARLIPDGKHVNEKAVEFYRNDFLALKNRGMELAVVLYWFDMPVLYEKKGGFSNREIIPDFVFYCKEAFRLFGDIVDIWYVYNEPIVDVEIKYQVDTCWPNIVDFNIAMNAIYNMVVAHAAVVKEFKTSGAKGRIGSVIDHGHVYPRSQNPADLKAQHLFQIVYEHSYEDPIYLGYVHPEWFEFVEEYGAKLDIREGDAELMKENTCDLIGINYYYPTRVKAPEYLRNPEAPVTMSKIVDMYDMPGARMNKDRGWEIFPQALYDTLMHFKNNYGNPTMYITENGMGIQDEYRWRDPETGIIQDDYRIEFVKEHLVYAHKAIEDGANLVGYNMWSFIDLWSPSHQFKNCYGFYEFDLKTKEVRKKKSADWFKKVTDDNGFEL